MATFYMPCDCKVPVIHFAYTVLFCNGYNTHVISFLSPALHCPYIGHSLKTTFQDVGYIKDFKAPTLVKWFQLVRLEVDTQSARSC